MRSSLVLLSALLLAGCASADLAADPAGVDGLDTLVGYLDAQGFTLEPDGLTTSTLPLTAAATYRVTGLARPTEIEAFEFESEEAAREGLTQLRSEIRPRGHQEVYASGPLVVYARAQAYGRGLDWRLRRTLSAALGAPRGGA